MQRTEPLMVPEASRSPVRMGQPLMAWWASCCAMVQYMPLKLVREITLASGAPAAAAVSATIHQTTSGYNI